LQWSRIFCRRRPSRFDISGSVAGSFESITVAGPRGNFTRFPILPDLGAPEAQEKLKELKLEAEG